MFAGSRENHFDISQLSSPHSEHQLLISAIKNIVSKPELAESQNAEILALAEQAAELKKIGRSPSEPISTALEAQLHSHSLETQTMHAWIKNEALVKILHSYVIFLVENGFKNEAGTIINASGQILGEIALSLNLPPDILSRELIIGPNKFYGHGSDGLDALKISEEEKSEILESLPDQNFAVFRCEMGGAHIIDAIRSLREFFDYEISDRVILGFNSDLHVIHKDSISEIVDKIEKEEYDAWETYQAEQRQKRLDETPKALEMYEKLPTFLRNTLEPKELLTSVYGPKLSVLLLRDALYLTLQLGSIENIKKWYNANPQHQESLASGISADSGFSQSLAHQLAIAYMRHLEANALPTANDFDELLVAQLKENKGKQGVGAYLDSMYAKIKNEPLLLTSENRESYAALYEKWGWDSHANKIRKMSYPDELLKDMYL